MRSYSGRVAYGVLALVFGVASWGCSGSTDVIPGPGAQADAGDAGDSQVEPDVDAGQDADAAVGCDYTLTFAAPTDGTQLTEVDDADGDFCVNGFQYDVTVATSAPDGTIVALYGSGGKIADAAASAGLVRFASVHLTSMGSETLRVEIPGTECSKQAQVSVACSGAPECEITAPEITATHPELNGVPVAEGGDRVSAAGSPYQVAFEVHTTVADGQPVILNVDGTVSAVSSNAVGGVASFPGVTLTPDGDHTVIARCVPKVGVEGQSSETTYAVDTQAPPLSVKKVKESSTITDLQDGDHWNPEDDADPNTDGLQIRVCGTTDAASAADALDLPASLGAGQQNFCVAVGTSSPMCTPATTGGADTAGDGACVNIECPGNGPFDMTLTLRDDAGNPTVKSVQGVTCASTLPQVQFLDPVGDGPPWSDINKRILAASMAGSVQRVDKDPATAGAQYDVVVCTSVSAGTASLSAGLSSPLTEIATANVEADTNNLCASSEGIVRFNDVTIPQSQETAGFALQTPTTLQAEVTSVSNGVGTTEIQLWVDTTAPSLSTTNPSPLCGHVFDSVTDITTDVSFASSVVPVHLTVGSTAYTGSTSQFGIVTIPDVLFPLGINTITATNEEPAGNVGSLPTPCEVTVGNPPTVTWQTPTAASKLAASTTTGTGVIPDGNAATGGWQGTLRACTNIDVAANPGATVQFEAAGASIGSPVALDGSGCAELANVDLQENNALVLKATTSPIDGIVGTASITVPVDVTIPNVPTAFGATVLDRRETSFQLSWTSPSDGTKGPASYRVRSSRTQIASESDFASASPISYSGVPAAPGSPDGIAAQHLYIENDYYFAVVAVDVAGNRSPMAATTGAARAEFNRLELSGTADERFGFWSDGSGDINGDGLADLIVGASNGTHVYIFLGSAAGLAQQPDVTISGPASRFGYSVAAVGDVNGDGVGDFAVGSPFSGLAGEVYVFYGRSTWPATLTEADAGSVLRPDPSGDPGLDGLGYAVARAGDFDGDGTSDFLAADPVYNNGQGIVFVVYGVAGGLPAEITPPDDYGTHVIAIKGSDTEASYFGYTLLGIPGFAVSPGSTLVIPAPYAQGSLGRAYAFQGLDAQAAPYAASDATAFVDGDVPSLRVGLFGMNLLRNTPSVPRPSATFALPYFAPGGGVRALSGPESGSPVDDMVAQIKDASATLPRTFGRLQITSALPGSTVAGSFLGTSSCDIAVSRMPQGTEPARVFFVDGALLPPAGTASDIASIAVASVDLPAGWVDFGTYATPIGDLDGDGHFDLAIPDATYVAGTHDGRLIVLW